MNPMCRMLLSVLIIPFVLCIPTSPAKAQIAVAEAIKLVSKKVIKAIDLQIQRFQNNTLDLQNIQKQLENALSKLRLDEIANWTQRQKDLYQQYFDELWRIKSILTYYHRLSAIVDLQKQIFNEYRTAYAVIQTDDHFSLTEKEVIHDVYSGMLDASITGVDDIITMMKSFTVQMSDADRLALIDRTSDSLEVLLADLRSFNAQNIALSRQRAARQHDMESIKQLLGL